MKYTNRYLCVKSAKSRKTHRLKLPLDITVSRNGGHYDKIHISFQKLIGRLYSDPFHGPSLPISIIVDNFFM